MKITFIKPRIGIKKDREYIDEARMEPLQLAMLAGMTPKDVDVACYDDRFETIPFQEQTDLVAMTVETFTARRAYEIAARYRTMGAAVVMGGMHPTLLPSEVARHADAVCTGDAESFWPRLVGDFKNGTLKNEYRGGSDSAQGTIVPDRSIFRGKKYLPVRLMQFSRGCKSGCGFCATAAYFGKGHYVRPVADALSEIQKSPPGLLFFVDDNLASDPAKVKPFLQALIPLKKKWITQLGINAGNDPELVSLLAKAGCLGFVVGLESIRTRTLTAMGKTINLEQFDKYESQIGRLRDAGLELWATFTLGHDSDTLGSIEDTVAWALRKKFAFAAFNVLTPYPGTPLYRRLHEEGRLLYDGRWWLHDDYRFNHAPFTPKHMTADQLTRIGFTAKKVYNTPSMIVRRGFSHRTGSHALFKLWFILRYGLLFRGEVYKKQDLILGKESVTA